MRNKGRLSFLSQLTKVFILTLLVAICGCSGTRYLAEQEVLYEGAELFLDDSLKMTKKGALEEELEVYIKPQPNEYFLGSVRPSLWLYNIAGTPKKKGLRYWIKNKLGKPPVLFDSLMPPKNADVLQKVLFNRGYFNASVNYQINHKPKTAKVIYRGRPGTRFTLSQVVLPQEQTELFRLIRQMQAGSLLKVGKPYDLQLLSDEITRISTEIKNKGFFYFSPDYLSFKADTVNSPPHQVALYLQIKSEVPPEVLTVQKIRQIYILPDYLLDAHQTASLRDTLFYKDYIFIQPRDDLKPKVIAENIFFKPGITYSRFQHDLTLSRLMDLNVFKFANIKFVKVESDPSLLDVFIYLTPWEKKSVRAEVQLVTKSNNYTGPKIQTSFRNRNTFKGAEELKIGVDFGFETQISGQQPSNLNSFETGLSTEILVPRIIAPFRFRTDSIPVIPKTRFALSYKYLSRVQYYNLNSFNFSFGYKWNSIYRQHELNPLEINLVQTSSTTAAFDSLLNANDQLRNSFENQFIVGTNYSFTYSNKADLKKRNTFYFNANIDVAGNLLSLGQMLVTNARLDVNDPGAILGNAYAQFTRFAFDVRHYRRLNRKSSLAGRLILGAGFPYGNSSTLPYIKQFFVGGTNSIRGFRARSVGPGIYQPAENEGGILIDQTGDIKLEGNLEYRFDIYGYLKGAAFLDVGNIWLTRENPDQPGSQFQFNTFSRQLAVASGLGLRVDASFFVLRFDFGIPLRKPQGWVINDIKWGDKAWRKQNVILNIGIGYPF